MKGDESVQLNLTNNISFIKYKNTDTYISTQYFDEEGNLGNDEDRYKATVELVPKTTSNNSKVSIDEISNDENTDNSYNVYFIKEKDEEAKLVNIKPTNSSSKIEDDETIKIEIKEKDNKIIGKIITPNISDSESLEPTFDEEEIRINMDLKYCIGKIKVEVTNETKIPLNLCILNNSNTIVDNEKGTLYEYYRSEEGSKMGTLYNVNIRVVDKIVNESKPIFETSFVQNINTE